jgi:prepilin-type N-terminal cleavage/methylation domain-containing protein
MWLSLGWTSELEIEHVSASRGFTLIELLVVTAVVGLLAAMLLPAVQVAREASRRTTCLNHLRQIGLALHGYHDVHRALPVGCLEWRAAGMPPSRRQLAWSAFLLPFLEELTLAQRLDFGRPFDDPRNAEAAATRVTLYECPSVVRRRFSIRAPTDYGGLFGQLITDRQSDNGVFLHERLIRFRHIRDGLSRTVAVAEDSGGPDGEWINGRNVFVQSGTINDPNAWIGDNEIRSMHPGGAACLFMDAHADFRLNETSPTALAAMITRAKGD